MGALIWLASYPKSGNTWMRVFLHNLLRNPPAPIQVGEIESFTLGDAQASWYSKFTDKNAGDLTSDDLAALRPKVHQAMMSAHPDSVFVKTHSFLGDNCGVPLITMECTAGAIYILRNPLDTVLSFADHFGVSIGEAIDAMAREEAVTTASHTNVMEFVNSWSNHVKSWTQASHSGLLAVRYEDMLDDPVKTFTKVAGFLGLRPPRARILKAIRFSSFKELRKQEDATGFKERSEHSAKFFRSGKKNQWRQKLSEDQVRRIVDCHREQMAKFGYLPKGY